MGLRSLSGSVAIAQMSLLAATSAPPALASGWGYQTSTPDNSMTPESIIPDNSQQSPNIPNQPRPPWGAPYWSNGNICRDQGVDMVCLTPQEANKLRWPIPSEYPPFVTVGRGK